MYDVPGLLMEVARANGFQFEYADTPERDAKWVLHVTNCRNERQISFIPHFPLFRDEVLEGWNCRDRGASRKGCYNVIEAIRAINNLR